MKYLPECHLKFLAEEEKGKHIKKQMHVVFVNKTGCQKPVVLLAGGNEVRIHDHATDSGRIVERKKTYQNGETNYQIGDCQD